MENENESKIENIKHLSSLILLLGILMVCISVFRFLVFVLLVEIGGGTVGAVPVILLSTLIVLGVILSVISNGIKMLKRKSLNAILALFLILFSSLVILTIRYPELIIGTILAMIICIIPSVYLWRQRKLFN